jgi:hypothetical protein
MEHRAADLEQRRRHVRPGALTPLLGTVPINRIPLGRRF